MTRTIDQVIAWARNPSVDAAGEHASWAGRCEEFINNSGDFDQAFSSALIAGSNSGPLRTDYVNAGVGAIIYFGGANGDGHDAWVIEQSGDPLLLMASSSVDINWGRDIGTIRLSRYLARTGLPLRGWTFRHGTQTLALSAPAGTTPTPIPTKGTSSMYMMRTTDGTISLVTESGIHHFSSIQHVQLFERLLRSGASYDTFLAAERDIMLSIIASARDFADNQYTDLVNRVANVKVSLDTKLVAEEIANRLQANAGIIDAKTIAAAVDEVLADDFAAVPAAVFHHYAEELTN